MGIKIESDFKDYYDYLSEEKSNRTYKRYLKSCRQKGQALNYLNKLGIETIEIKQVSKYDYMSDKLVVYTDPKLHSGKGKKILDYQEAIEMYSNYMASRYIANACSNTIKVLQVGKLRFRLHYKSEDNSLELGTLQDVKILESYYNILLGIPIYSIDYISDGIKMVAVDFNEVEKLKDIGMHEYIEDKNVITEINNALIKYKL